MQNATSNAELVHDITVSTVYLLGASFVLGSLFTILLLMMLDFIRRNSPPK
jgi:hypothetical protein